MDETGARLGIRVLLTPVAGSAELDDGILRGGEGGGFEELFGAEVGLDTLWEIEVGMDIGVKL